MSFINRTLDAMVDLLSLGDALTMEKCLSIMSIESQPTDRRIMPSGHLVAIGVLAGRHQVQFMAVPDLRKGMAYLMFKAALPMQGNLASQIAYPGMKITAAPDGRNRHISFAFRGYKAGLIIDSHPEALKGVFCEAENVWAPSAQ